MAEIRNKPTKEELLRANGSTIKDVIGPNLDVLFCGINPGLYSAAIGHHFGKPGNRFWPALHASGFTPRQLSPYDERGLLILGYGLTNLVERATAQASELQVDELRAGLSRLDEKVKKYRPQWVAILGVGAYRDIFGEKKPVVGRQARKIGNSNVWLLPNPSGLNAHFTLPKLTVVFQELQKQVNSGAD